MMTTIKIRPAQARDFPALWQLAAETCVYLPEPENDIWIAEKSPTIVGFIACGFAIDEMSILGLAVKESERGQNIATLLHKTAIDELKPALCFLEVRESNLLAQRIYQKWHYRPIGRRKNYYRTSTGEFEDAIVMRLEMNSLAI